MALDTADILLDASDQPPTDGEADPRGRSPRRGRGRGRGAASASSVSSPSSARGASAKELASMLAKLFGGASMVLALFLVGPADAPEVAMTPGEAQAIADPAARMLAKSRLAKRAAALAAKGGDALTLTFAVASYGMRIYPLLLARAAQTSQKGPYEQSHHAAVAPVRPAEPAAPASAGASPAVSVANLTGAGYSDPDAAQAGAYGNVAFAFPTLARQ